MSQVKVSISSKLILFITLLLAAVVSLSGVLASVQSDRVIGELGGKLNTQINKSLRAGGTAQLELLIQLVRLEILQHDYTTLQTIVDNISENHRQITAIAVSDRQGTILAHTDEVRVGGRAEGPLRDDMAATNLQIHDEIQIGSQKSIAFTSPVEHGGKRLGGVLIAYTLKPLQAELDQVQLLKDREGRTNVQTTLVFAVISGIIGLVLAVLLGFQLSRPIRALVDQADKIAGGALEARVRIGSQDEIGLLGDRFNYMAEQVQSLMRESVEKTAMEKELEVASAVQATLVPDASSAVDLHGINLAGFFRPATKCGGDWWTYYRLPDEKILVVIGDVTGHGVGSAMITAAAKGATSCLMAMTKGHVELKEMFDVLNAAIIDTARGKFVMSCFAAIYDPKARTLSAVNAGHNFPFHYSSKTGRLVSLVVRGNKLGDLAESEFEIRTFQLEPNDKVIWYTDGIIECVNEQEEEYGERRLRSILKDNGNNPPDQVRDNLVTHSREFFSGVPPKDDITIVVGEIT